MKRYLPLILLLVLRPGYCKPSVIHIPADYSSIQEGINHSTNGDTVLVQPGKYLESIDFHGKKVLLASLFLLNQDTSYIHNTVIDGNQQNSVLYFRSGEDTNSMVIGFTIQNGYWRSDTLGFGAGIYCVNNSSPKLMHLIVKNNEGFDAGGIFCRNSTLFLDNVRVESNKGASYGNSRVGGTYCVNSNLICNNVTIQNNKADIVGAIYSSQSNLDFVNVRIMKNTCVYECGGIMCIHQSLLRCENSEISNNQTYAGAGGISCRDSKIILRNVEVSGNASDEKVGGGLFSNCEAKLDSCSIHHNTGNEGSGLRLSGSNAELLRVSFYANVSTNSSSLDCFDSQVRITNCTFYENSGGPPGHAGAVLIWGGKPVIINSIFWANSPKQIGLFPNPSVNSSFVMAYSDIENGQDGISNDADRPYDWLNGNINLDPEFVDPQNYDIRLSENSPCVDSGTPFLTFNNDTLVNLSESEYSGAAPEMGAKEFKTTHGVTELTDLPESFVLTQNFPNPFQDQTTISFETMRPGYCNVEIYSTLGRKINEFELGKLPPGRHSVQWNATDQFGKYVGSGVYIIRVNFPNGTRSVKVVYIKK